MIKTQMIETQSAWTLNRSGRELFAVGRVRVLERSLLRNAHLERAAAAGGVREAWDVFREASRWWRERDLADGAGWAGWEDTLGARLSEALREVAIMVPSSPVPGLFALRWDFLELKERARRAGLAPEAEADWADAVLEGEGFLLGGGAPPDYRRALVRAAEALAADPRPQTVDRALDAEMFRAVFRRLDERPVPAARAYFSRRADLLNVGVVLRGKRRRMDWGVVREWLVEGGSLRESVFFEAFGASTDSFAAAFAGTVLERLLGKRALADGEGEAGRRLERLGDDHLTDFLRLARYVSFGPEPLVGYLHGVEVEVKNVRRVLTGLALGEDAGGIRAGLRRAYV